MKDKFNENLREARLRKKLTQQQLLYCRQRGSNPHKVGVYTYV